MLFKKDFDDLVHLIKSTNKVFNITPVSETRIIKQTFRTTNINLKKYCLESTLDESSAEGTPLYIANHLSYKHVMIVMFITLIK